MWETIQKMLLESSLVQGLLTLGVTSFVCTMLYQGKPVTQELWALMGVAWGFYFGSKSQQSARYVIGHLQGMQDDANQDR
jgi:hypothetical protein